jgi:hypothetical protein
MGFGDLPGRLDGIEIKRPGPVAGRAVEDQEPLPIGAQEVLSPDPEIHRNPEDVFGIQVEVVDDEFVGVESIVSEVLSASERACSFRDSIWLHWSIS